LSQSRFEWIKPTDGQATTIPADRPQPALFAARQAGRATKSAGAIASTCDKSLQHFTTATIQRNRPAASRHLAPRTANYVT